VTAPEAKPTVQILFVDDDQLVRDFAVHTLEFGLNRQVITFDNGFNAWQFIQQQPDKVDIIIADANLPDMDGYALLRNIKKTLPEKHVIITAGDPALEKIANQLGADGFISKPYDAKDLFAIIKKYALASNPSENSKVTVIRENRTPPK
jgi:CheY-like chemotaxis protein